jgi:hypothetical protein
VNITPDDLFDVSLRTAGGLTQWTPVAKDGAALPAGARPGVPAGSGRPSGGHSGMPVPEWPRAAHPVYPSAIP